MASGERGCAVARALLALRLKCILELKLSHVFNFSSEVIVSSLL